MAPKVPDEDLKKLLMSWYYAGKTVFALISGSLRVWQNLVLTFSSLGYYTGLFEGKQQAQTESSSGSKSSHR